MEVKKGLIMSRRSFLKNLAALTGGFAWLDSAHAHPVKRKILQMSPVAGFQYYAGDAVWSDIVVGQSVQLMREKENRYDERAVRVDWHGQKLGYLPWSDNAAVSQLLDCGERLEAVIVDLVESSTPWGRGKLEVRWVM